MTETEILGWLGVAGVALLLWWVADAMGRE